MTGSWLWYKVNFIRGFRVVCMEHKNDDLLDSSDIRSCSAFLGSAIDFNIFSYINTPQLKDVKLALEDWENDPNHQITIDDIATSNSLEGLAKQRYIKTFKLLNSLSYINLQLMGVNFVASSTLQNKMTKLMLYKRNPILKDAKYLVAGEESLFMRHIVNMYFILTQPSLNKSVVLLDLLEYFDGKTLWTIFDGCTQWTMFPCAIFVYKFLDFLLKSKEHSEYDSYNATLQDFLNTLAVDVFGSKGELKHTSYMDGDLILDSTKYKNLNELRRFFNNVVLSVEKYNDILEYTKKFLLNIINKADEFTIENIDFPKDSEMKHLALSQIRNHLHEYNCQTAQFSHEITTTMLKPDEDSKILYQMSLVIQLIASLSRQINGETFTTSCAHVAKGVLGNILDALSILSEYEIGSTQRVTNIINYTNLDVDAEITDSVLKIIDEIQSQNWQNIWIVYKTFVKSAITPDVTESV